MNVTLTFCATLLMLCQSGGDSNSKDESILQTPPSRYAAQRQSGQASSRMTASPESRYDVDQFYVAGVKLGMTPSEVKIALAAQGFLTRENGSVETYQNAVEKKAREFRQIAPKFRILQGPYEITGSDNKGRRITVGFLASREKISVSYIDLFMNSSFTRNADVFQGMINEYGPASNGNRGIWLSWCDIDEPGSCGMPASKSAPKMDFKQEAGGHSLRLSNHLMLIGQRDAEIASLFSSGAK